MIDPLTMASTLLGAAQSVEGPESAFYLARCRVALEEAKQRCDQLEIVLRAREAEAARIASFAGDKT